MNATHTVAGGQSEQTEALARDQSGEPVQPGDAMMVTPSQYMPHSQIAPRIFLSQSPLNFRRPLDKLAAKLRDPRFDFLFRPSDWGPDVDGELKADIDSLLATLIGGQRPHSRLLFLLRNKIERITCSLPSKNYLSGNEAAIRIFEVGVGTSSHVQRPQACDGYHRLDNFRGFTLRSTKKGARRCHPHPTYYGVRRLLF